MDAKQWMKENGYTPGMIYTFDNICNIMDRFSNSGTAVVRQKMGTIDELFGMHFNGLHCYDITKEGIIKFAEDYAEKKMLAKMM